MIVLKGFEVFEYLLKNKDKQLYSRKGDILYFENKTFGQSGLSIKNSSGKNIDIIFI